MGGALHLRDPDDFMRSIFSYKASASQLGVRVVKSEAAATKCFRMEVTFVTASHISWARI